MHFITNLFSKHPADVGETYLQHMAMAFGFGAKMIGSGLACLVHGIFPFFCVSTGSQTVTKLHDKMVAHRNQSCQEGPQPAR